MQRRNEAIREKSLGQTTETNVEVKIQAISPFCYRGQCEITGQQDGQAIVTKEELNFLQTWKARCSQMLDLNIGRCNKLNVSSINSTCRLRHDFDQPPSNNDTNNLLTNTTNQVKRMLSGLCPAKAAGGDSISPRVLKAYAPQLCVIFQHLFNLSLCPENVHVLLKTSCLVPVPKKARPSAASD